jgi:hypothetical protein
MCCNTSYTSDFVAVVWLLLSLMLSTPRGFVAKKRLH